MRRRSSSDTVDVVVGDDECDDGLAGVGKGEDGTKDGICKGIALFLLDDATTKGRIREALTSPNDFLVLEVVEEAEEDDKRRRVGVMIADEDVGIELEKEKQRCRRNRDIFFYNLLMGGWETGVAGTLGG